MPSASSLLTLSAILALTTLPNTVSANTKLRKKRNLRRKEVNGINIRLEEDVEFFTNMARRTQDMSVPSGGTGVNPPSAANPPTPNMSPSDPPQPVNKTAPPFRMDTAPPVVPDQTMPPVGVVTGPPVPVAAIICAQAESCVLEGSQCSDGTREECCGDVFDAFLCDCISVNGNLELDCFNTNTCADIVCGTESPVSGPDNSTPSPVPAPASGFNCPDPSFVGCTAIDTTDPQDDCPVVGEPCPGSENGEFCCRDACPRNFCTAKQAPSDLKKRSVPDTDTEGSVLTDTADTTFEVPMPDDWHDLLKATKKNPN